MEDMVYRVSLAKGCAVCMFSDSPWMFGCYRSLRIRYSAGQIRQLPDQSINQSKDTNDTMINKLTLKHQNSPLV